MSDHKYVLRWWERVDKDNRNRGREQNKNTEDLRKIVKRMMVGTKQGAGGVKIRKDSIRETRKRLRDEEKIDVSYGTVRKCVGSIAKYRVRVKKPRLNDDYAARRFRFADDHVLWRREWDNVLNTDSSPFYVNFASNRKNDGAWCVDGVDPPPVVTDKYCLKTECYVGVTRWGMTPPVFIDSPERVNAANYVSDILPTMARAVSSREEKTDNPTTTRLFRNNKKWIFEQDLARPHISKVTLAYLAENVPKFWTPAETPPKLFEWPIEQFWNELERRVYKRGRPKDLKQLKNWIRYECNQNYWFEWLANTWDTFPRRIQDICEAEGWYTDN